MWKLYLKRKKRHENRGGLFGRRKVTRGREAGRVKRG
jgi:hypothetical protein